MRFGSIHSPSTPAFPFSENAYLTTTYRTYDMFGGAWMQVDPKAESVYNMTPYCSMNNNPISVIDPDGDLVFFALVGIGAATGVFGNGLSNISNGQGFFDGAGKAALWGGIGAAASFGIGTAAGGLFGQGTSFGKAAIQFGAHGLSNGLQSYLQGGSFGQGFLSGSISSGLSSGATKLNFSNAGMIGVGGLGGGIGSAIAGGNFFDGMTQGLLVAGFNHALHSAIGGDPGDPPTKEELKVYLAGEFLDGRISRQEYINAIALVDDGPWGLLKQVASNNKVELAATVFPVGRLGMLGRYFASLSQLGQSGKVIANVVRDAPRLVAKYGGKAGDWRKMASTTYKGKDGFKFSTHWYQNVTTGARVEYKTVLGR